MVGYYLTSGVCLFLLAMIPIWSARSDQPSYPLPVLVLLAVFVFVVPLVLRRRKREGAATPGALAVTVDNLREVDAAAQQAAAQQAARPEAPGAAPPPPARSPYDPLPPRN